MTIQDSVLALLDCGRGTFLSGENIASTLGVSRAAVWKAVDALRSAGCPIEAVTRRGYRLSEDAPLMSAAGVEQHLCGQAACCRVEVFPSLPSTNTHLCTLAAKGAPANTVVIASEQTAGRGRRGRTFFSPRGSGVYLSVLLRPSLPAEGALRITTVAAVAMCEAIFDLTERKAGIKWVNDILLDGRKVCGILTEAAFDMESGSVEHAVLGVGMNLFAPADGYPKELAAIAGSIFQGPVSDARNRICAAFLNRFYARFDALDSAENAEAYRARCAVIGKRVLVLGQGEPREAIALDVDDRCRLLVRYDDGKTEPLSSGEISVKTV